jgi:hypothetical protein
MSISASNLDDLIRWRIGAERNNDLSFFASGRVTES